MDPRQLSTPDLVAKAVELLETGHGGSALDVAQAQVYALLALQQTIALSSTSLSDGLARIHEKLAEMADGGAMSDPQAS